MPVCPYANHRLRLDADGSCERCQGDLRLYALLHQRSVALFNEARRQWDEARIEEASYLAHAALALREQFAEAHWLLGAIDVERGDVERARQRLDRARQLGARVELSESREPDAPVGQEGADVAAAVAEDGRQDA